jgi:hypothetical protein
MQQAQPRRLYDHELRAIGKRERAEGQENRERTKNQKKNNNKTSSFGPKAPIVNITSSKHRK